MHVEMHIPVHILYICVVYMRVCVHLFIMIYQLQQRRLKILQKGPLVGSA